LAGAAYAELYAESRQGGNARSSAGMSWIAPHRIRAFHYSGAAAAFDIFPAHYAGHYKYAKNPVDYRSAFNNQKTDLFRHTQTVTQPCSTGLPRTFPHQTFPNPVDI